MKKITESAEKICEVFDHPFDEYLEAVNALTTALIERRQLEQTSITEDWLKEHGWEKKGRPYEWKDGIWVQRWNLTIDKGDFQIYDCPEYDGYTWKGIELTSVAKLLDALDLCGIKID